MKLKWRKQKGTKQFGVCFELRIIRKRRENATKKKPKKKLCLQRKSQVVCFDFVYEWYFPFADLRFFYRIFDNWNKIK